MTSFPRLCPPVRVHDRRDRDVEAAVEEFVHDSFGVDASEASAASKATESPLELVVAHGAHVFSFVLAKRTFRLDVVSGRHFAGAGGLTRGRERLIYGLRTGKMQKISKKVFDG